MQFLCTRIFSVLSHSTIKRLTVENVVKMQITPYLNPFFTFHSLHFPLYLLCSQYSTFNHSHVYLPQLINRQFFHLPHFQCIVHSYYSMYNYLNLPKQSFFQSIPFPMYITQLIFSRSAVFRIHCLFTLCNIFPPLKRSSRVNKL